MNGDDSGNDADEDHGDDLEPSYAGKQGPGPNHDRNAGEFNNDSEEDETLDEREQDAGDVEDERDERDHAHERGEPSQDEVPDAGERVRGPRKKDDLPRT